MLCTIGKKTRQGLPQEASLKCEPRAFIAASSRPAQLSSYADHSKKRGGDERQAKASSVPSCRGRSKDALQHRLHCRLLQKIGIGSDL